ncbi:MAG TPA: hypothetical protein VHB46_01600 [Burkholderiales bacterium]|nr:hypothetical protein [Burkholderiales bacterium]
MNLSSIFAAMLCAATLWPAVASAQRWNHCDPRYYFITPANCTTYAEQAARSMAEMRVAIAEENIAIAAARKRFWETYPDKPGAAEARDEFGKRLDGKDSYYLWVTLTDALGGVKFTDIIGGKLDGGIPRYTSAEFKDWVEEIKRNLGESSLTQSMLSDPSGLANRLARAMAASEKKRDVYLFERNWAEFDAVGREPAGLDDPAVYFQALCIRGQRISWEEAQEEFSGIVKALGRENVLKATQLVHAAPRERFGVLKVTMPPPVKRAPGGTEMEDDTIPLRENVIGVTASAIRAVERLATQDDDRRYLLWLLTDLSRRGSDMILTTKWQYAEAIYQRLATAFGEPGLLQASRLVRTATKRATSSDVMNPAAIGATRGVPLSSFQDVLARGNPRGYLRAALLFKENLESAAAVDTAYKKLVSSYDEAALLDAARKTAAGRPNVTSGAELDSIKGMVNRAPDAVATLVDFPEYLAWKKFGAGARVTYAHRIWQPATPGSDRLVAGAVDNLKALQLQFIDAEKAKLWISSTLFDRAGKPKPPQEMEQGYPAKFAPRDPARFTTTEAASLQPASNLAMGSEPASTPVESGEETVEVNGRPIATRWQSKSYRFNASSGEELCSFVVKVWTSDEVPTWLIRKTEDKACPAIQNRRAVRYISETWLDSFDGFTPATAVSSRAAMKAYVPPNSVSGNVNAPVEATSVPGTKSAPATVPVQRATSSPPDLQQRAADIQKQSEKRMACSQQAIKDHPAGGAELTQAIIACTR